MAANLIVIKIGSSSLTNSEGLLDAKNIKRLARQISKLVLSRRQVVLVSSGAIVSGSGRLGYKEKPRSIFEKQAAAAVGQSLLMRQWEKAFERFHLPVGQILLTADVFKNPVMRQNAYNTIHTLLKHSAVPVVNENDTVSVDEIKVGDNDNLSAMVSVLMKADLLINLTDVDGFYVKTKEGATLKLDEVEEITEKIERHANLSEKKSGTGGMITKLEAAKLAKQAGIPMVIAHGKTADIFKIAVGEKIGTRFIV